MQKVRKSPKKLSEMHFPAKYLRECAQCPPHPAGLTHFQTSRLVSHQAWTEFKAPLHHLLSLGHVFNAVHQTEYGERRVLSLSHIVANVREEKERELPRISQ